MAFVATGDGLCEVALRESRTWTAIEAYDASPKGSVCTELAALKIPAPFPDNGFKEETNLPTDVNLVNRFDVICRFCLAEKKRLMDIFQLSDNAVATVESLVDIKIKPDDMLPKQICVSCHELVNQCLAFKQQVASTDTAVRRCIDQFYENQLKQVEVALKVEDVENSASRIPEQRVFDGNSAFNELNEGYKFEEVNDEEDYTTRDEVVCVKNANLYSEFIQQSMEDGSNVIIDLPEGKSEPINGRSRKSIDCEQCNKTFSCSSHLQPHIQSNATIRTNSQSRMCSNDPINLHTIPNEGSKEQVKAFELTKSSESSAVEYDLSIHESIHPEDDKIHNSQCGKDFLTLKQLRRHVKTHCNNKARGLKMTISRQAKKNSLKCSHCSKLFGNSYTLAIHLRRHTGEKPYQCPHCEKSFSTSSSLVRHVRTHTGEKPYKCLHCTKSFRSSCTLAQHMHTHIDEKPYKCPHCSKSFSQSSNLVDHVRKHTVEKPFKCSHCSKSFLTSSRLAEHVRTHTGEKPFKCPHCSKSFLRSSRLTDHVRTHTGEKPFKCSHCSKSFAIRSTLVVHLRTHTDKKPFKCPHCIKSFRSSTALLFHQRSHTGEKSCKCPHCSKPFLTPSKLAIHVRTHTSEKPYKCSHCSMSFITPSKLVVHVRSHTGESPFKCSHCSKAFRTSSSLARHVRIHTGEKPYKCPNY